MAYIEGRVQDCSTGHGLSSTLTDNVGNFWTTTTNGFFSSGYAYPGYQIKAGAYAHEPKTHIFTAGDIDEGWVTICLEDADIPTSEGVSW